MIRIVKRIPYRNGELHSGRFYLFKYLAFENDPEPLGLLANICLGVHESTGHMHNYFQMINFNYLPMQLRLPIYKSWINTVNKNESFAHKYFRNFWTKINSVYPIDFSLRRYRLYPPNLIQNLVEVDPKDIIEYFENPTKMVTKARDKVVQVDLNRQMRAFKKKV